MSLDPGNSRILTREANPVGDRRTGSAGPRTQSQSSESCHSC